MQQHELSAKQALTAHLLGIAFSALVILGLTTLAVIALRLFLYRA
jgi:hypothetical protein